MSNRKITVTVTEKDIAHGRSAHCYACPVARALQRHVNPDANSLVFYWSPDGKAASAIRHTDDVVQFISEFDRPASARRPEYLKPFSFEVEVHGELVTV